MVLAVLISRRSTAQPSSPKDDTLGKHEQLVLPLLKRGESNTVTEIAGLISTMHAEQSATEVGLTVAILESLRSGCTNEAYKLLETRLDGALMTFGIPSTQDTTRSMTRF